MNRNPTNPRRVGRLALVAAVGLALPGTGRAFYFDFGPGSGASPPPSLVPVSTTSTVQPAQTATDERTWTDYSNPDGGHAPEPATGVAGLIGLGVVGLAKRRRVMAANMAAA